MSVTTSRHGIIVFSVIFHVHMKTKRIKWRNPLMSILYALNVLGRVPFTVDDTGEMKASLVSLPVGWAILIILLQGFMVMRVIYWTVTHAPNWESFNRAIITLNLLLLHAGIYQTVVSTWRATPKIVEVMNQWTKFYNSFLYTTNQTLSSTILDNTHIGAIIIFLASLPLPFGLHILGENLKIHNIVKAMLGVLDLFYVGMVLFLWSIYCILIRNAADILKDDMIKISPGPYATDTLLEYRLLWLNLHSCAVAFSDAFGQIMQLCVFQTVAINLLSQFGVLMYFFVDHTLDSERMFPSFIVSSISLLLVFSLSYWAQKSMSTDFLKALCSRRWIRLSPYARTELDLFLDALQMSKPCFELLGLFILDRYAIISVFQVLCTYLVVLMQLKVSTKGYLD